LCFVVPDGHTHVSFIKRLPPVGHEEDAGVIAGVRAGDIAGVIAGGIPDGVRPGVIAGDAVGVRCSIIFALTIFLYI